MDSEYCNEYREAQIYPIPFVLYTHTKYNLYSTLLLSYIEASHSLLSFSLSLSLSYLLQSYIHGHCVLKRAFSLSVGRKSQATRWFFYTWMRAFSSFGSISSTLLKQQRSSWTGIFGKKERGLKKMR